MTTLLKTRIARRAQRGFTLFEASLVLFIGGAALVAGTISFNQQNAGLKATQTADGISSMLVGVKERYGSLGSYSAVSNSSVIANTLVPSNFPTNGATITTPFGSNSTVTLASADSGATFTLTVTGLPTSACAVIVSRMDSTANGIGGGATAPADTTLSTAATATTIKAIGGKLDSGKAFTQCADGGGVVQLIAKAQ